MRRLDTKIFIDQQPRTKSKTKAKRLFLPFGFPVLPVLHLTPPLLLALVLPGLQDLLRPLDLVPGPLPVLRHEVELAEAEDPVRPPGRPVPLGEKRQNYLRVAR